MYNDCSKSWVMPIEYITSSVSKKLYKKKKLNVQCLALSRGRTQIFKISCITTMLRYLLFKICVKMGLLHIHGDAECIEGHRFSSHITNIWALWFSNFLKKIEIYATKCKTLYLPILTFHESTIYAFIQFVLFYVCHCKIIFAPCCN